MKKIFCVLLLLFLLCLSCTACDELSIDNLSNIFDSFMQNEDGPDAPDAPPQGGTGDPATCTHAFGDWAATTPATCELGGLETRSCSLCGEEEERSVLALGHDFGDGMVGEAEQHYYVCKRIGCSFRQGEGSHYFAPSNRCYDCGYRRITDDPIFTFVHVSGGYMITGYNGDAENVIIPLVHQGKAVVGIGDGVFAMCREIQYVNFSGLSSIEEIGEDAFMGCSNMTTLSLPRSVEKVGMGAFRDCINLSAVSFGFHSKLEEIDCYAFENCKKLRIFTLPSDVTYIGAYAFGECDALSSVTFVEHTGWYIDQTPVNVRNDATNAEHLRGTFAHCTWFRND